MSTRRAPWLQIVKRAAALAVGLLAMVLTPAPARGEWKSAQQVTLGTAQVLEQGAANIGIISPLAFGLTGQLTLQTHPILMLLLTPNAAARYRLVDQGNYVVSATGAIKRSLGASSSSTTATLPAPGEAVAGAIATVYLGQQWALTGGFGYAAHLDEQVGEYVIGWSHGVAATAEVHHLMTPIDLLQASLYWRYGISHGGLSRPVATLAWTHGFKRFLGGAHLMVILTAFDTTGSLTAGWLGDLPVLPTLDLWWRL